MNEYIKKRNVKKYLTLVPSNKSKGTVKEYEELRRKVKDLTRSITL